MTIPEIKNNLHLYEDTHDIKNVLFDIQNNNFMSIDDLYKYKFEYIVQESIINGQIKQAKSQCEHYNLDYSTQFNLVKTN